MGLKDLKQLERAEFRRLRKVARAEAKARRKASRREAFAARWPRWTAWWEARAREIKIAATVVGGAAGIVTGGIALYKNAAPIWRATVGKAWALYRARDVGRPALPPGSGDRMFVDRVDPPDSGSNK